MNSSREGGQSILSLVECRAGELARTVLASESSIKVFVFGSQATGRALIRSDIDLSIDLGHPIKAHILRGFAMPSTTSRSCNEWTSSIFRR